MDHQDFYCLSGEASCFLATCFTSFPKKQKNNKKKNTKTKTKKTLILYMVD